MCMLLRSMVTVLIRILTKNLISQRGKKNQCVDECIPLKSKKMALTYILTRYHEWYYGHQYKICKSL